MKIYLKNSIKKVIQCLFPKHFFLTRTKHNGIIFSFDDGPHPKHTPIIIEYLGRKNIKAIFFVTGKELEKYPDMGRLIVQHGHILGNHTYEHLDLNKCNFAEYICSIERTKKIISSFQPNNKIIFRPPYGRLSLKLIGYIVLSQSILMNWTVDSRDSFIKERTNLAIYVKSLLVLQGDILLFHEDYIHTIEALPGIIDHLVSFNTVSQLDEFIFL